MANRLDIITLNHKFIVELLECYKNHPALWKIKSREYKDKKMKAEAYEILINKCREYVLDADRDFVRNKINSLRTNFRKEYKKVLASKATATKPSDIYKPQLWYFDLIAFTVEQNEENSTNDNIDIIVEDASSNSFEETLVFLKKEDESLPSSPTPAEIEDPISTLPAQKVEYLPITNPVKRKKIHELVRNNEKIDDIYDVIGKNVAHKLRGMNERQRIIAEKIISDVMYHGQMETLTTNSHLNIDKDT